MNALVITIGAAFFAAFSNYIFRKSTDNNNNVKWYLVFFYLCSFSLSLVIYPEIWNTSPNFVAMVIGGCVGILNITIMWLTSRALQEGPAGLTFAFQNSSAIFPGMLLFIFFGRDFGFNFTLQQGLGMLLVVAGLFWGARSKTKKPFSLSRWLKYAGACLVIQALALTIIQGRCVLFDCDKLGESFSFLSLKAGDDACFILGQFGVSCIVQLAITVNKEQKLQKNAAILGAVSGLANVGSTCLLLYATQMAQPFESTILFPCFSVATIVLCNAWAKKIYKENFNLIPNALCGLGLFIGIYQ